MRIPAIALACAFLNACAMSATTTQETTPDLAVHPVQQATLWVQTSAEYRGNALQAWRSAAVALDKALADSQWHAAVEHDPGFATFPPAIIVDVDETVLDNSPFEAQLVYDNASFSPERWSRWVGERRAPAVPGALEFLTAAAQRGVTVFYVTNRDHEDESATVDNLRTLGFPLRTDRDVVLTRGENGWGSDKGPRRALIAKEFRIVLLAGDDFNDFVSGTRSNVATRDALAQRYRDHWGERWIVLPNPLYGSWDRALLDFASDLSEAEKQRLRLEALRR